MQHAPGAAGASVVSSAFPFPPTDSCVAMVNLRLVSCRMASSMSPHFSSICDTSCGTTKAPGGGK